MAHKLDTITARNKLPPRREPYWVRITKGCYLGYRRMAADSPGTWLVRCRRPGGELVQTSVGALEQHRPHERFDKAVDAARAWYEANLPPTLRAPAPCR